MTSTPVPDVHRHRAADPSPRDGGFLRVFLISFFLLGSIVALLVGLTDPLGRLGTGLVPPVVSADRDYKATLYRRQTPPAEVLILGSSRVKTLAPACIGRLGGRTGFNFGVNGGGSDDLLAVYRFARAATPGRIRQLIIGVDPETLEENQGRNRALEESHALARWNPGGGRRHRPDVADLLSMESVLAALRSLRHLTLERAALPQEVLGPDGVQSYPAWDDEIRRGQFAQEDRVLGSIPGVLSRYATFPALSTRKVGYLRALLETARADSVEVIGYIPPVHPALERAAAASGALEARRTETDGLLRAFAAEGLLRYVPLPSLASFGGDSALFYDAIHMMPENSSRLLGALYRRPGGCALQ